MDWKIILIVFTNLTLVTALKNNNNNKKKNTHILSVESWVLMFMHGVCYDN